MSVSTRFGLTRFGIKNPVCQQACGFEYIYLFYYLTEVFRTSVSMLLKVWITSRSKFVNDKPAFMKFPFTLQMRSRTLGKRIKVTPKIVKICKHEYINFMASWLLFLKREFSMSNVSTFSYFITFRSKFTKKIRMIIRNEVRLWNRCLYLELCKIRVVFKLNY